MTVVLRGDATETVLTEPGLYWVSGDGKWSCDTVEPAAAAGFLAIHVIGDFVSSSPYGHEILLNNRAPLGRLQKLQVGDVIEIHRDKHLDGKTVGRTRFVYARKPPPIRFVLPASSPIRCAYTQRPLAGEAAVRCANCCKVFDTLAWAGELGCSCPSCRWLTEEGLP